MKDFFVTKKCDPRGQSIRPQPIIFKVPQTHAKEMPVAVTVICQGSFQTM